LGRGREVPGRVGRSRSGPADFRIASGRRWRPPQVCCPVGQDHVTLALASLPIGLAAMVADKGRSVGLRQPAALQAALQPSEHIRYHATLISKERPFSGSRDSRVPPLGLYGVMTRYINTYNW
jgi:hypothetical protein